MYFSHNSELYADVLRQIVLSKIGSWTNAFWQPTYPVYDMLPFARDIEYQEGNGKSIGKRFNMV